MAGTFSLSAFGLLLLAFCFWPFAFGLLLFAFCFRFLPSALGFLSSELIANGRTVKI